MLRLCEGLDDEHRRTAMPAHEGGPNGACFLRAKEFDITLGTQLEPLAKEAQVRGYPLMSVIIWRALLNPILERGTSKAYYHAAQYLSELRRLSGTIDDHRELPTHAEYDARLRERHGRKTGFWRQMSIRP